MRVEDPAGAHPGARYQQRGAGLDDVEVGAAVGNPEQAGQPPRRLGVGVALVVRARVGELALVGQERHRVGAGHGVVALRQSAPSRATVVSVTSIDFDALRPQLADLCRRYGIAELSVFGSVARGDDGPGSDVDLLYVSDPAAEPQGWTFFDAWDDFARLLGREVDLVPKDHLHWVIRERVLADARVLYAA